MELSSKEKIEKNIGKIWLIYFLDGLWFPLPVYVLYILDVGMNMTELGILMGLAAVFQFLLDIPSSILADKYSRKSVLVIAGVAYLLCDVAFLYANSFIFFIPAFVFWGITTALMSGIVSAFTYDTMLSLGRERKYETIQARIMRGLFFGRAIASLGGVFIYSSYPKAVFIFAIIVNLIMIATILTLQEPPREKSISKSLRQVKEGFSFLLSNSRIWSIVIFFSLMVATCDTAFSYYQPVLRASGIDLLSIGIVYFGINILSSLGSILYIRLRRKAGWRITMAAYILIDLMTAIAFSTLSTVPVLVSISLLSIAFGSQYVYMTNIIHKCVPSSHRATTLSVQGQIYMFFYAINMGIVGLATDNGSLSDGMRLNALIVALLLCLFIYKLRDRRELAIEVN